MNATETEAFSVGLADELAELDRWQQSPDELASRRSFVDAKEEIGADVGGRSLLEHPSLDVVEFKADVCCAVHYSIAAV